MTDCLLIPLNFVKINNYATVEKRKKMTSNHLSLFPSLSVSTFQFSLASIYLSHQPIYLSTYYCYFFHYFVFHCFLATVRIFVSCYCSLFVCFFFFLCFLLFFVFIVVISHSVSVSEMKLFVRLTLCVFSSCMSSSPISYSLLMST